jgi:hypothetical protein
MTQKIGRSSSTDVEDHLNSKLHPIQAHEGKVTMDSVVWLNREMKAGRKETSLYCDMSKETRSPPELFGMQLI